MSIPFIEDNDQTRARREHLEALRALVGNTYPNKFARSNVTENRSGEDTITSIIQKFSALAPPIKEEEGARPTPEEIERANAELKNTQVRVSGRIATPPRVMGKAAFVHLSDGISRLQIYVRKADVIGLRNDASGGTVDGWELFSLLDHGDFIGVRGYLFVTKTGELSVHVRELQFLAKALLPMPDKMHGIADPEIRQRQRYADLIAGSLKVEREEGELTSRETFERRSKLISEMRRFLDDHGFLEVETPMLSPIASGAAARPFTTHHNALGIDLNLRIAPELYLKRLLVGGFERVYELNRNFRNEGIGYRWNPEFTMLEFYCAYMDVKGMMDFCEEMLRSVVETTIGQANVLYHYDDQHIEVDFSRFARLTMKEAIFNNLHSAWRTLGRETLDISWLDDPLRVQQLSLFVTKVLAGVDEKINAGSNVSMSAIQEGRGANGITEEVYVKEKDVIWKQAGKLNDDLIKQRGEPTEIETAQQIIDLFESFVERKLIQPTFIYDFPKAISPLSKATPDDSSIAERFELFVAGMEIANGFSELNDPVEQRERFAEQMHERERGDEEAMMLDEDYIRALSYGMPPAAGIGIGIDRLVMLLTNKRTIRDVILFPHMRPERKTEES